MFYIFISPSQLLNRITVSLLENRIKPQFYSWSVHADFNVSYDIDRYRADVKLRAGKLEEALVDVKKAMELYSTSSSLYR